LKKILLILPFVIILLFSCRSRPAIVEEEVPEKEPKVEEIAEIELAVGGVAKSRAVEAMERARSIRADVAVREDFNAALAVFKEAEKEIDNANKELVVRNFLEAERIVLNAETLFLEAEELFLRAYETTRIKREEARIELNRARSEIRRVESEATGVAEELGEETVQASAVEDDKPAECAIEARQGYCYECELEMYEEGVPGI